MNALIDKVIGAIPQMHKTNEVYDPSFCAKYGASQNSGLLKVVACREGQTFNVYWLEIEHAARYTVAVYKCVEGRWYTLTTVEIERDTHYLSLGGLVGEGYVFRVTAEDRSGAVLASADGY